jgi:glutathione reductase (NADPH)
MERRRQASLGTFVSRVGPSAPSRWVAVVAAGAGAEVCIVQRGARPLEGFDPDLVGQLVAATRALGVDVRLGTTVVGVERRDGANGPLLVRTRLTRSRTEGGAEESEKAGEIGADLVIHAAGRAPKIGDLALHVAGVAFDPRRGVGVNAYLQSVSNPAVYAAGDAADGATLRLTPVAGLEGGVVAQNLLRGNSQTPDFTGAPTVVYSIPPLARVGLLEREAREQGLRFTVRHEDTSGWYSSRRVGLTHTGYKVLVEEGTSRILGAHLLGDNADEVINLFSLAMRSGLTADALRGMVYAYPTSGSHVSSMV